MATSVRSSFVEVPGARLYYEIAGEGEPVVFLHGGLLDGRMWDEQIAFFASRFQTIRYDVRCAGQSEDLSSPHEPYIHYQDLYHLLRALSIPNASLVGLSGGTRIAIDLALAYPEMVKKLVAASPGISGYKFVDPWTSEQNKLFAQALAESNLPGAIEAFLTMWTDGPHRSPEQVPQTIRERVREMSTRAITQGSLPLMMRLRELEPPAITRLAALQAPTLLLLGEKDTSDIYTTSKLLHEQVADTNLVMIPDVAHMLNMENPTMFNVLVEQFLLE
jgi:3-oxoadipate enol-lactonase